MILFSSTGTSISLRNIASPALAEQPPKGPAVLKAQQGRGVAKTRRASIPERSRDDLS